MIPAAACWRGAAAPRADLLPGDQCENGRTSADASDAATAPGLRGIVRLVALLNLAYFGVEFVVASAIGSVSLFADSIDFLEDASINLLILAAMGWSSKARARMGMLLAAILLIPALATAWSLWSKFNAPTPPAAEPLMATAVGALLVNLTCALMLAGYRRHTGSLTRAAFLSARNDVLANVAIVVAGAVTAFVWRSPWPDAIVGLAIAALSLDAAGDVWAAARNERVVSDGPRSSDPSQRL